VPLAALCTLHPFFFAVIAPHEFKTRFAATPKELSVHRTKFDQDIPNASISSIMSVDNPRPFLFFNVLSRKSLRGSLCAVQFIVVEGLSSLRNDVR
jgi:hypothetical protein